MKRIILLYFLFCVASSGFAQQITTPYDFPIKGGSAEWQNFKSRSEMADALQIPGDILKNLTTEALAKTCLNFPMFKDLYFFNYIQTGFNTLKQSFNGFQELLSRGDAGSELLKVYKSMNPKEIGHIANDTLKGDFSFHFVAIEILLSQNELINSLSTDIKTELLDEAASKYKQKKDTKQFSDFSLNTTILFIGRVLDKDGKLKNLKSKYKDNQIENFLSTGFVGDPLIIEQILASSIN